MSRREGRYVRFHDASDKVEAQKASGEVNAIGSDLCTTCARPTSAKLRVWLNSTPSIQLPTLVFVQRSANAYCAPTSTAQLDEPGFDGPEGGSGGAEAAAASPFIVGGASSPRSAFIRSRALNTLD